MIKSFILMVFICFVLIARSATPQDDLPEIGVTRLAPELNQLHVHGYVHMFVFAGSDGVLLIDSGFEETAEQVKDKLKELGYDGVQYLINTHSDRDHTGGNGLLGRSAIIIAHTHCRDELAKKEGFPKQGLPSLTFDDCLTLHFNDEVIHLHALPGGHTDEDVVIHFKRANIVFLGDLVISDSFPVVWLHHGEGIGIDRAVECLDTIISKFPENTRFVVSHGRELTMEDIRAYRAMIEETTALVRKALEAGKTAEDLKKANILEHWISWNSTVHSWINTDFWIDTICQDFVQR